MFTRIKQSVSALVCFAAIALLFSPSLYAASQKSVKSASMYNLIKEAETFYEEGAYDKSEANCRKIIEMNDKATPAYNILGMVYSQRPGLENEAIKYFEKSLMIDPMQADVYGQIAFLLNKIEKVDEAIDYMKKGLTYNATNFQLNFNLGLTYLMKKRDPYKAIEYLKRAQPQNPKNERLAFLLGLAYLSVGDKSGTIDCIIRLREIKDEYLASLLENCLRSVSQTGAVDMNGMMDGYNNRPKKEAQTPDQPKQGSAVSIVSGNPAQPAATSGGKSATGTTKPKTRRTGLKIGPGTSSVVKGEGTITIESTAQPKPDAVASGSNFE